MRNILIVALLLALIGCKEETAPPKKAATPAPAPSPLMAEWDRRVLKANGPVLVDFGATWCPPCRAMDPVIARLSREFQVVKIDVDDYGELARRYSVTSIPRILIFNNGQIIADHLGVTSETQLRAEIEAASKK